MRIIPIITAILVSVVFFYVVIERDSLLNFARSGDSEDETPASNAESAGVTENEPAQTTQENAVPVQAIKSTSRAIDSAVILRGETSAARQVDVMAETSGLMISDPLRKGTMVSTGDVLCRLDPGIRMAQLAEAKARLAEARAGMPAAKASTPEAEALLAQALAQLEEAKINDNAARKLSQGGFASETRVASAEASVRAAEASVKAAEAGLQSAGSRVSSVQASIESAEASIAAAEREIDRLTVRAPFDGLLETDTSELGSLLNANGANGALCATVIQLDPIKIVGFIPETDIARVQKGAAARARLISGREVRGNVSFLSRSADPSTRTFRVEIEVPNTDLSILDGQTAEIAISADGTNAHLIPQSALTLNDGGKLGVRIITDQSQALFVAVSTIRDTANGIWVNGLEETAHVIVIGQEYVTDGVPVLPTYMEATQ